MFAGTTGRLNFLPQKIREVSASARLFNLEKRGRNVTVLYDNKKSFIVQWQSYHNHEGSKVIIDYAEGFTALALT
jgi:hypothetical protein